MSERNYCINQKSSSENKRELNARVSELGKLEKRNTELNALFKRLYEDNVLGKVTNEQLCMLSNGYNTEQREIQEQIPILQKEIKELKAASKNAYKTPAKKEADYFNIQTGLQ